MAKTYYVFFRTANFFIRCLVGRGDLIILSDSEPLSKSLTSYYKQVAYVLPIPHTPTIFKTEIIEPSSELILWLPGAPRMEKGINHIKKMAAITNQYAQKMKLIIAKSSGVLSLDGGMSVELVNERISRDEYERQFILSDFILLLYDVDLYSESTSGIFVEAIVSGTLPLVSKGTWMEYELIKYGLGELAIDCNSDSLLQDIISISNSNIINKKLQEMQNIYKDFHSKSSFSKSLKKIHDSAIKFN
jgi:hypothetical protein